MKAHTEISAVSTWANRPYSDIPDAPCRDARFEPGYQFVKRLFDIVVSAILIAILFPLFLLLAAGIMVFDRNAFLFKQKRVGKNSNEFLLYKFRTMIPGNDIFSNRTAYTHANANGKWKKSETDKRITPFGRLLRKTSLDELPQLFNVLKGDMSLVGPRPLPALYLEPYKSFAAVRARVKPGITGLWQIRSRTDTRVEAMMPHDLEYINSSSFWRDIKILMHTLPAVISRKGAL